MSDENTALVVTREDREAASVVIPPDSRSAEFLRWIETGHSPNGDFGIFGKPAEAIARGRAAGYAACQADVVKAANDAANLLRVDGEQDAADTVEAFGMQIAAGRHVGASRVRR